MTDEDHKTINRMYAAGEIPKARNRPLADKSKYAAQTTWPARRKPKSAPGSLPNTVGVTMKLTIRQHMQALDLAVQRAKVDIQADTAKRVAQANSADEAAGMRAAIAEKIEGVEWLKHELLHQLHQLALPRETRGSLVNTVAFPNTKRIAVDRVAASEARPCIYVIEDDVRASRVKIACPCCKQVVAEVRWSGVTTDAPTVWIEVGTHVPLKVFTDIGDR